MNCSTFERWARPFDPNAARTYAFRLQLPSGITVTGTPTFTVLEGDGTTDVEDTDVARDLTVTAAGVATVDGVTEVRFRPSGGAYRLGEDVPIRMRYQLSNGDGDDWTMLLAIRHT